MYPDFALEMNNIVECVSAANSGVSYTLVQNMIVRLVGRGADHVLLQEACTCKQH